MDMKRPLMPGFLKKAEQKLLLNKPGLWSTRIHLVLYYGILFMALLAVVCFMDPLDMRRRSMSAIWVGYTSIMSIIAMVVWLIYLLRFNVFKKYGVIHPLYSIVTFIFIFIATVTIVLFTYVQMAVESVRANNAYGGEEIVQDINSMNLKLCQLENASLHVPWDKDTVIVLPDSVVELRGGVQTIYTEDAYGVETAYRPGYEVLSESVFSRRRKNLDSVVRINDSMHEIYEPPPYAFVYDFGADEYTRLKTLSSFEIYHKAVKPTPPADRQTIVKEVSLLIDKYLIAEDTVYDYNLIEKDDSPFEVIRKKYRLGMVNNSISHVTEKKYRWLDGYPVFIRVVYYIAISISLLIFIFRHSTVKTFFLSLLAAVLLSIFTTLFLAYSGFEETSLFMAIIVYTILFFFGSMASWVTRKRNVIVGIATNLFVLLVPIFPLMIATWYYEMRRRETNADPDIPSYTVPDSYWLIAEWSGAVLFLILLATYIHRVYRRWYSLPEE